MIESNSMHDMAKLRRAPSARSAIAERSPQRQDSQRPSHSGAPDSRAFSILELMLVLAVSSILATIAVVLYQDYVQTARLGVLDAAIASIEPFQEAHNLQNGTYATGSWRFSGPEDESLFDAIGWHPSSESSDLVVEVNLIDDGFRVRASNSFNDSVCREYPSRNSCPSTP